MEYLCGKLSILVLITIAIEIIVVIISCISNLLIAPKIIGGTIVAVATLYYGMHCLESLSNKRRVDIPAAVAATVQYHGLCSSLVLASGYHSFCPTVISSLFCFW